MNYAADEIDALVDAVSALAEETITITVYLSTQAGSIARQVTSLVRFTMTVIWVSKRTDGNRLMIDGENDATVEIALAHVTGFEHLRDETLERIEITEVYEPNMERRIYIQKIQQQKMNAR